MIHWDPANPEAALFHHRAADARSQAWRAAVARTAGAVRHWVAEGSRVLRPAVAGLRGRRSHAGGGSLAGPCPGG